MLIDITNFNFECDDKGGSFLIDFNFACDCKNNGGTETPYDIDVEFARANERGNVFTINGTEIRTTNAYYKGRLKDLGFDKVESFSFNTSLLTKINAFPSVSNVKTLQSVYNNCTQLTEIPDLDYPNNVNCNTMFANTLISELANTRPSTAQGMYSSCPNLTEVDVSHRLNYASDVSIFIAGCTNLTKFTFGANVITPTNLFNFFYGDTKLSVINDISNVKLDNATDISGMFYGCSSLTDIANINFGSKPTSLLTNASNLFNGSGLDLITVNQANYPVLYKFFTNCINLTNVSGLFANSQLGKGGWEAYNDYDKLDIFYAPIENCSRLFQNTKIRYVDFGYSSLSTVTDCSEMFSGCYNLERVSFDGIDLREDVNYSGMFQGCSNLNEIQFNNTPSCTSVNILKAALEEAGLTSQVTFNFTTGKPNCGSNVSDRFIIQSPINSLCEFAVNDNWIAFNENNEEISFFDKTLDDFKNEYGYDVNSVTFYGDVGNILDLPYTDTLTEITISTNGEIEYLDLSRVNLNALTNLDLRSLYGLVHLDLSNWQTVNITDNSQSWTNIPNLKTIKMLNCSSDAISFVQQKLGDGDYIIITEDNNTYITVKANSSTSDVFFDGSMQPLMVPVTDINDWGYSSFDGKYVDYMFESNTDVTSVFNLPSLSGTTRHKSMFLDATNIKYLDCRKFDFNWASDDQDITNMFYYCSSVKWLNLSGWDLTNAYEFTQMFNGCSELKYVFAYGCNEDTIGKLNSAIDNSGYSINLLY